MCYNLLAQDLIHTNAYLYHHVHASHLEFTYRFPLFIEEVKNHNPDVRTHTMLLVSPTFFLVATFGMRLKGA